MSTYRFASVAASAGRVDVALRGAPHEAVPLLFAFEGKGGWACAAKAAVIGPDGKGTASFVAPAAAE